MTQDWDKLGGEEGQVVPTGRFSRALKLGTMSARVTASALATKIGSAVLPMAREKRDEMLSKAYSRNAKVALEVLGNLKGASMKVGQMLSADPELLPQEFSDVLRSLQRSAPPMPYATVKSQIERALDRPMETVFRYFDPTPLGAASIGQVHRARLVTGEDVAVKVQYPGVAESLESDLKTLKSLLGAGRAVFEREKLEAYFAEIQDVLLQECDYLQEARNLERFQKYLAPKPGLRCPRPYIEFSHPRVLVMELMQGEKLDEALQKVEEGSRRDELMVRWVATFSWMFHELGELHIDPHPGNFLLTEDDELIVLDFGCIRSFEGEFTDGFLDVLDACWQGDHARAIEGYLKLGFGGPGLDASRLDPDTVRAYNEVVLAPFMRDVPFDFGSWSPARDANAFMVRHPSLLLLTPPAQALPYFRVLSGIKGLLARLDARVNVFPMAVETARRRGRLTAEPRWETTPRPDA